jgi:hypothetical protein
VTFVLSRLQKLNSTAQVVKRPAVQLSPPEAGNETEPGMLQDPATPGEGGSTACSMGMSRATRNWPYTQSGGCRRGGHRFNSLDSGSCLQSSCNCQYNCCGASVLGPTRTAARGQCSFPCQLWSHQCSYTDLASGAHMLSPSGASDQGNQCRPIAIW